MLPSDYDTAENHYRIFRYKGGWWFTINNTLRAVILDGVPEGTPTWENNPPYALGSITESMGKEFQFKTKVSDRSDEPDYETGDAFTFELSSKRPLFGLWSGQPTPPRQFALYNENTSTRWSGLATGGSVQTSHPVPIWGYPNKTLYFESDAAGTLDIEVYVGGGWRVYDSPSITANELLSYNLPAEMQAPIMRCVYTPTNADTIAYGEVHLA